MVNITSSPAASDATVHHQTGCPGRDRKPAPLGDDHDPAAALPTGGQGVPVAGIARYKTVRPA
ncbi:MULTISPECIES: hypothetical protein [unclassified Photorhabdus]|uniref:hypothetical protein n=1 Tax=unclassified Photorhabdus TaxID=2620880 RepID=UPI001EFD3D9D|nr:MULTISPECIES: hypothetical protein [unclassified Photorhabdus]